MTHGLEITVSEVYNPGLPRPVDPSGVRPEDSAVSGPNGQPTTKKRQMRRIASTYITGCTSRGFPLTAVMSV